MKILFVTDLYPIKANETTTPLTLHNFVSEWEKQGHSVDVLKPNFVFNSFLRGKPFYKQGVYDFQGVRIFNFNYFTPFWFDLSAKFPKELDVSGYDVIIAHMPSGIISANILAKRFKKPLVCGVHVSDIEVLTNPLYSVYFKSQLSDAYKRAQKIACRSFVLQKKFIKLMPELASKTFVASSGVQSVEKLSLVNDLSKNRNGQSFKVLTCANLIKRKNIDKLILAINDLDGFELEIIGDGKQLTNLKKISSNKVKFLGRMPHEGVLAKMRDSKVFVLPSVNETFGMVYIEAMASGCVTVCSENDGLDGIIKDGENGFLTEPSVEGLKHTLLRIKGFDVDKIAESAFNTAREYTLERCAENYLSNILTN